MSSFGSLRRRRGLFVYDLPLLTNWHSLTKLKPEKGKTYQYFALNWWDLCDSEIFQKSKYMGKGELTMDVSKPTPGYMFVNCSTRSIQVTNTQSGDVYNIPKYASKLYNQNKGKNTLKADYPECLMQYVRVGDATLILLGLEYLLNGQSDISKTPLYRDLLLALV